MPRFVQDKEIYYASLYFTATLAGATVLKRVLGFGATARIRTTKILDLSADLSMVVEIVDEKRKIEAFQPLLTGLFDQANCGGLVTLEKVRVVPYAPEKELH